MRAWGGLNAHSPFLAKAQKAPICGIAGGDSLVNTDYKLAPTRNIPCSTVFWLSAKTGKRGRLRRTASYPPGTPGYGTTAIYGGVSRQSQPLSNSVERCCWTEPNLDAPAHLSNPLGSALGCRPGITPIRPSASRAHIGLARPEHRRLELQRLNAVFDSLCRRHKMLLSLGFLSSFLSVFVLAEELQAAGAS